MAIIKTGTIWHAKAGNPLWHDGCPAQDTSESDKKYQGQANDTTHSSHLTWEPWALKLFPWRARWAKWFYKRKISLLKCSDHKDKTHSNSPYCGFALEAALNDKMSGQRGNHTYLPYWKGSFATRTIFILSSRPWRAHCDCSMLFLSIYHCFLTPVLCRI